MYFLGGGVPEDDAEAVRWYRLAADRGYAGAQFNLGAMYTRGEGVLQDDAEAARRWRLAADQGYAGAQSSLGKMYANGRGVPQDDVLAHMWLDLSAARTTDFEREVAVRNRDSVAGQMNPTQIAEVERLACEWDVAHPREPHLGPGAV